MFRDAYLHGLKRLLRQGKLKLGGSVAWLQCGAARKRWLDELEATDWNVFIEGPPQGSSDPRNVVKYLARYISGGPIADRRIIKADSRGVTFWARPKTSSRKRRGMNRPQPYRLSGEEFVRRWCLHILPRGFTRCRRYGGFHNHHRAEYMARSRKLLKARSPTDTILDLIEDPSVDRELPESALSPTCHKCEMATTLVSQQVRPSWKDIFFTSSAGRAPPCRAPPC